jgi:hypothetical protein
LPCFQSESETTKKFRLVPAFAMRGRKQVMGDFSAWHDGTFGIGQSHGRLFSYLRASAMSGQVSEFALDFVAMRLSPCLSTFKAFRT